MLKLAQVPDQDRHVEAAEATRAPRHHHLYYAFLSYSHQDEAIADWLHDELEQFKVPHKLVGKLTVNGVVPHRLAPIFRDRHELAAADDLATEIKAALASSRFLIVMCSPAAARSHWTNAEIETFKRSHPEGCVLGAIVDGEPFASEVPGREDEECFPPALRYKYDRRGHRTTKRAEPLAADFREGGDGRRVAFLKLVAGMLGVGLDELVQRETTRRQRRVAWLAAASIGGMAVTSTLAVTAIQSRDAARDQRREAEGLVAFMLGDLKDKLEPIGRLDVLDGVGSRVLQYYRRQDTSQLSDQGLAQRSKALTLMGQIARDRGDLDRADALYRAAYAGTEESIRREPDDPQRLYDHAQNAFYIADVAVRRGRLDAAETAFREYRQLADRMVALDPDSIKWRMEVQYAATNLGYVLYSRRRFPEAVQQFARSLASVEALAAADPNNDEYQRSVSPALELTAVAQEADGRLADALASRRRSVELLAQSLPRFGAEARFRLIPARRDLGHLYLELGSDDLALQQFRAAVAEGEKLLAVEPTNAKARQSTESARLMLARQLFDGGDTAEAAAQTESICSSFRRLVAQDPTVAIRRAGLRDCLMLQARVAARFGRKQDSAEFAAEAVQVAESVKSTDNVADQFGVATALRVQGDVRARSGDSNGARSAWAEALGRLPRGMAEQPDEMHEHAVILERLGRSGEAQPLNGRLAAIGYRLSQSRSL
jgi:tetratricopeptide (TPR) repeat protein